MIDAVYLWVEYSLNRDQWLTHLALSHADVDNSHYKALGGKGWVCFTHTVSSISVLDLRRGPTRRAFDKRRWRARRAERHRRVSSTEGVVKGKER